MKKAKTSLALTLFAALVLSCFAACDLGGKTNETAAPQTEATPSSNVLTAAPEPDETTLPEETTAADDTAAEVTTAAEKSRAAL